MMRFPFQKESQMNDFLLLRIQFHQAHWITNGTEISNFSPNSLRALPAIVFATSPTKSIIFSSEISVSPINSSKRLIISCGWSKIPMPLWRPDTRNHTWIILCRRHGIFHQIRRSHQNFFACRLMKILFHAPLKTPVIALLSLCYFVPTDSFHKEDEYQKFNVR